MGKGVVIKGGRAGVERERLEGEKQKGEEILSKESKEKGQKGTRETGEQGITKVGSEKRR